MSQENHIDTEVGGHQLGAGHISPGMSSASLSSSTSAETTESGCILLYSPKYQSPIFWDLPSMGMKKEQCGDYITLSEGKVKVVCCPRHGKTQSSIIPYQHERFSVRQHCNRPECPVCSSSWAKREAESVYERMMQAERLYKKDGKNLHERRHIVLSPPQDLVSKCLQTSQSFRDFKKGLSKIFEKLGVKGGLYVFHPWRIKSEVSQRLRAVGYGLGRKNPASKGSLWQGIKKNALNLSSWTEYVNSAPHIHGLMYGFLQGSEDFYRETGWTYKNKGARSSKDDTIATIKYILHHCGLAKANGKRIFHSVVWFGVLSYNKVCVHTKTTEETTVKCSCGSPLHIFSVPLTVKGPVSEKMSDTGKEYTIRRRKVTYILRKDKQKSNVGERQKFISEIRSLRDSIMEHLRTVPDGMFYVDVTEKFGPESEEVIKNMKNTGDIFEPRAGILKVI